MIEPGKQFKHKGKKWEVLKYDQYEDKFLSRNLESEQYEPKKFTEKEILGGINK